MLTSHLFSECVDPDAKSLPGLYHEPYLIAYSAVSKKPLAPAVLRTCKQVYDEALAVLYAGKTFCYGFEEQSGMPGCEKKPWRFSDACHLRAQSVQRIETLEILAGDGVFAVMTPARLADIITYFGMNGHALKR